MQAYVYSKKRFDLAFDKLVITINPNMEFQLYKTKDDRIIVERTRNGIKLIWEITLEELNKYFKRTSSAGDKQPPIEI